MSNWVDIGSYFFLIEGSFPMGDPEMGLPLDGYDFNAVLFQRMRFECDPLLWPAGNVISKIKVTMNNRPSCMAWQFFGGDADDGILCELLAEDSTSNPVFELELSSPFDPSEQATNSGCGTMKQDYTSGWKSYGHFWLGDENWCGNDNYIVQSIEAQGAGSLWGGTSSPRLFRHTGRTVEYVYTAPPPPPYTPPPPVTSSPTPSRPPSSPPVANVTPPSKQPGSDVSGRSNRTMVPCPPGPSGENRYSIWETGPNNTLIRQISPCQ